MTLNLLWRATLAVCLPGFAVPAAPQAPATVRLKEVHVPKITRKPLPEEFLNGGFRGDIWFLEGIMESSVSIAECTHADGIHDERVQTLFKRIPASGVYVTLVQDSLFIAEDARMFAYKIP